MNRWKEPTRGVTPHSSLSSLLQPIIIFIFALKVDYWTYLTRMVREMSEKVGSEGRNDCKGDHKENPTMTGSRQREYAEH